MNQNEIEKMIREALLSMTTNGEGVEKVWTSSSASSASSSNKLTDNDYPLSQKKTDIVKSATGKTLNQFTIENVMNGKISAEDCRIAPETLGLQAEIAESVNRDSFAMNLKRASELIAVPDTRILEIYNALRPYRTTKSQLFEIADELENKYNAKINANFIREAAELYEKRGRLKV